MKVHWRPLSRVIGTSAVLAVSCVCSYWVIVHVLPHKHGSDTETQLIGRIWTLISTIIVYRPSHQESMAAALSRALATIVGVALSLLYSLAFPFHLWGMAALIGLAALVLNLMGRSDEINVAGITIAVVLIVGSTSPVAAWKQPFLRLIDTLVGISIGLLASWFSLSVGLVQRAPMPEQAVSAAEH